MKSHTKVEILALMALVVCGWARAADLGGFLDDEKRKAGKARPEPGELTEPMKRDEGLVPQKERGREGERMTRRETRPRPEPSKQKPSLQREPGRLEEKARPAKEPRRRSRQLASPSVLEKGKAGRPPASSMAPEKARARIKELGVKEVPKPRERGRIMDAGRARSVLKAPKRGPQGERLTQKMLPPERIYDPRVKAQMTFFSSPSRQARVQQQSQTETTPNHYYWHDDGGYRYCHYYDAYGFHWYGWYYDDYFFWARFYADTWWFYDPFYFRWCFWYGGWWWWQDPFYHGGIYLYLDGRYLMSDGYGGAPGSVEPGAVVVHRSGDGSATVKVMGEARDAFLYDTSDPPRYDPVFLASHVKSVKFSETAAGRPLQILLVLQNGDTELFDADGDPLDSADARPDFDEAPLPKN